jgi:aspartyl-tRNA(Asn)/glutamyl-tRNA(Gln) amidotransferase subunit A
MGSLNETSAYKKVLNPWDPERVPGGSSGGSAAAVAAGLVPWALGSDTGGSVRHPAAFCGIVGMKPTYGLVSRYGLVAFASSLDSVGVLTRTVEDNAKILSTFAGSDQRDSSMNQSVAPQDFTQYLTDKLQSGLKIGIIENAYEADGIQPEVKHLLDNAVKQFESLGAEISRVKIPSMKHGAAAYFMISRAEAASNLARYDGAHYGYRAKDASSLEEMYMKTRAEGFGEEVKRRLLIGNYVLSAGHSSEYYESAKTVQRFIRAEFLEKFKDCDVLLSPVTPRPAFKFGAFDDDALQVDLQDYFTAPINLAGIPAIALPCGFSNGLPVGFQLIGPDFSEHLLYHTAHVYEQANNWHEQHPPRFS